MSTPSRTVRLAIVSLLVSGAVAVSASAGETLTQEFTEHLGKTQNYTQIADKFASGPKIVVGFLACNVSEHPVTLNVGGDKQFGKMVGAEIKQGECRYGTPTASWDRKMFVTRRDGDHEATIKYVLVVTKK